MRRMCTLLILAVLVLPATMPVPAAAAAKYQPCSLLTFAEVEAVLGIKVARTREGDLQLKGGMTSNCIWITASPTVAVSLFVGPVPAGVLSRDVVAQAVKVMEEFKRKGGTIQVAVNTPDLWCARIVPPASDSSASPLAMCSGVTKGLAITLNVHNWSATGQQAKTLFDKAVARLP